MPKINVAKPFNFQKGGEVKRYEIGTQEVPQSVAEHAKAKGFIDPEAPAKPAGKGETKQ